MDIPFAPAGSIKSLFAIEGINASLERLTGNAVPTFITQAGYSSVEKVILKNERLSTFLRELHSPFDQFIFDNLAFFAFVPDVGPSAWFINAHWTIGQSCGFLYRVLTLVLDFENPTLNLSAKFGVNHSWSSPLAIHSFTLEGVFEGDLGPEVNHLHFTSIGLRLFGIRGMVYTPEPQSALEYGFEIFGTLGLHVPNSHDHLQLDFVMLEMSGAVQLSCDVIGNIWSAPLGISGLTLKDVSFSACLSLGAPWQSLTFDVYATFKYSIDSDAVFSGSYSPGQTFSLTATISEFDLSSIGDLFEHIVSGPMPVDKASENGIIGTIRLDMIFNFGKQGWEVCVALTEFKPFRLSGLLAAMCGDVLSVPDFVGNIQMDTGCGHGLIWKCSKPAGGTSPLILSLSVVLNHFSFTLLRLQHPKSAVTSKPKAKYVIVLSLAPLPSLPAIPLIGAIEQPFAQMQYVWVHDTNQVAGLSRKEVEEINSIGLPNDFSLTFTEKKPSGDLHPSDIVLSAGSHFVMLARERNTLQALLDYNFRPSKTPSDTQHQAGGNGASMAVMHKSTGPLSISNIGLQYKGDVLSVLFDAALNLGPIGFTLLGFSLGITLSEDSFHAINIGDLTIELRGLSIQLDQPPVLISGMFDNISTSLYAGGVALSMQPYSFVAFGSYGEVSSGVNTFKEVSVFAELEGPLIELEFAMICGITVAFGYNSFMRFPSAAQVLNYPLLSGIPDNFQATNMLTTLNQAFELWMTPQEGSIWLAAGLEVKAFNVLDVHAVVVVEFNPYVTLGIFAEAVCAMPADGGDCYLYVELGISCQVDFRQGYLAIDATLSPNSFILAPSCHLLGGFAFYSWFDPSAYDGDFVLTIGGYHPSFNPPSYYPQADRLAISWQLDDQLGITGEAFFAITPKLCMGGGSLSVLFSTDCICAWFIASASFFMVWSPFHFSGTIGVSVGVQFHLDLWLLHIRISAEISASLSLEGPPFSGSAFVDLLHHSFTIYFGESSVPRQPLTLPEFWHLLMQPPNHATAGDQGSESGLVLVVESGYFPSNTVNANSSWLVSSGFRFRVQCRFALTQATCNGHVVNSPISVYSKPMQCSRPMNSVLKLTIGPATPRALRLSFKVEPVRKTVPSAMWGKYNAKDDPTYGTISNDLSNPGDSTIQKMMMGIIVNAIPNCSNDSIPPFNAANTMTADVLGPNDNKNLPSSDTSSHMWFPVDPIVPNSGSIGQAWDSVSQAWRTSTNIGTQRVVDALSKSFGWKPLTSTVPSLLLDTFKETYLAPPLLIN